LINGGHPSVNGGHHVVIIRPFKKYFLTIEVPRPRFRARPPRPPSSTWYANLRRRICYPPLACTPMNALAADKSCNFRQNCMQCNFGGSNARARGWGGGRGRSGWHPGCFVSAGAVIPHDRLAPPLAPSSPDSEHVATTKFGIIPARSSPGSCTPGCHPTPDMPCTRLSSKRRQTTE